MISRTDRRSALVIGAGVTGLTTALVLARRGWRVAVAAEGFGSDTVSTVAGALWEWPPSVCGRHHDQSVLARSAGWAMASYRRFAPLAANPHTGVSLRPAIFYFTQPVHDDPAEEAKMRALAAQVPGFVHDSALIIAHGINPATGVVDAYSYLAPTIDTDRYLGWLSREARAAGATITRRRITGPLVEQEERLRAEHAADVLVNCTGLGAAELAADPTLHPHRGALIRLVNDGNRMPRITAAHAVAHDAATGAQDMVFIVPRGEDRLLIGGLVEPGQWDTHLTWENYPPIRDMLARSVQFLPALAGAEIDRADPLRVGLRPFRASCVRLEAEPGTAIVHNYGHGGAGVTLSWGCATEAADLAEGVLAGRVAA